MLYSLLYSFHDYISFFRIFNYISFRSVLASITSFIIIFIVGPKFIKFVTEMKFKEEIYKLGPKSHLQKVGTPTMGGGLILISVSISYLLWGNWSNVYGVLIFALTLSFGLIGFYDDYLKSVKKKHRGMSARVKFLYQTILALIFSVILFIFSNNSNNLSFIYQSLYVPTLKYPILNLGIFIIIFWMFIVVGSSNSVNITDGLDGLATGLSTIVLGTLFIFAYVSGLFHVSNYLLIPFISEVNEVCVFIAALVASCIGFLWFNGHPAQIFMGDTGSLSIGASIGMIAICIKKEILLILVCGVFIIEIISVIIQVTYFRFTGRRIFKMAPLHHHFELMGIPENKIVIRFWIIGIILALISLSTLKIN